MALAFVELRRIPLARGQNDVADAQMEKLDLEFLNGLIDGLLEGKWKANLEGKRGALVSYVESLPMGWLVIPAFCLDVQ